MPDGSLTWDDLVRGEITFETEHVPDFALCRANGEPLYTLVNPVDDALMEITHVLRGEDLLSSTPRQLALYEALTELGIAKQVPQFGHLPYVMGEGNKKLSKRDPKAHLIAYRDAGFLPEGLLNYLALLGWAISGDRDVFTLDEMVAAFEIGDVNPNPARFDEKKADAINAAHMRMLSVEEITERVLPFLEAEGVLDPASLPDRQLLDLAMPLVAERINKLTEAPTMVGFLFVDEDAFEVVDEIDDAGRDVVRAAHDVLSALHRVVDRRDPGGPPGRAGGEARAQAAGGVRPGAGRRHRPEGVAAAVRVARAARPRARPRPARPGRRDRVVSNPYGGWPPPDFDPTTYRQPDNMPAALSRPGRARRVGRVPPDPAHRRLGHERLVAARRRHRSPCS